MADSGTLSDAELAEELAQFGEQIQLPIKPNKRPILLKKLNHLRARARSQETPPKKSRSKFKPNSKPAPASGVRQRVGGRLTTNELAEEFIEPASSSSHHFRPSPARLSPRNLEAASTEDNGFDPSVQYLRGDNLSRTRGSPSASVATSVPSNQNTRERKREPQFANDVLRTLRRRTGEPPPRRTRRSDLIEAAADSTGNVSNRSLDGSEDEIAVPSPARSRLYPNLSKITSYLSRSRDTEHAFESSDEDLDETNVSTYEVENKSVNTSFPIQDHHNYPSTSYNNRDGSRLNASDSSFGSFSSSPGTSTQRFRSRRDTNRVQQYKSWYLESLPQLLVVVTGLFFAGITVTYIVTHKDFFMSWFSSSSNMGKFF